MEQQQTRLLPLRLRRKHIQDLVSLSFDLKKLANYVGQLRFYSYADLALLFLALGGGWKPFVGASLLWFGFLVHLEWRHEDHGRLLWSWMAWVLPWAVALTVLWSPYAVPVLFFGVLYALKKQYRAIGALSSFINGLMKGTMVLLFPNSTLTEALAVASVLTIRNFVGDVRDAGKDYKEGVTSAPILLHYRRNTPWVYPLCLAATSVLWIIWGSLDWWYLLPALSVQAATYRLTPR